MTNKSLSVNNSESITQYQLVTAYAYDPVRKTLVLSTHWQLADIH